LRANRQDNESEAIRKLFGARFVISVSASIIAKHSTVKEEDEGGKLFVKEMCIKGI